MLKLVPLQRGLQGGPEPQLGSRVAGALPAGTKMGQTVARMQYFTGSLSAVSEKRAVLGVTCPMGWQAAGGGMSPWVMGSSSRVLCVLEAADGAGDAARHVSAPDKSLPGAGLQAGF